MHGALLSGLLLAFGATPALERLAPVGILDFSAETTVLPANGVFFVLVGDEALEPDVVSYTSSSHGDGTLTSTERYGGLILYDLPEGPGRLSITVDGPDRTIATVVDLSAEHDDVPPGAPNENGDFPSDDTMAVVTFDGGAPVGVRTRDGSWGSGATVTGASCGFARAIDHAGQLGAASETICRERPFGGCTSTGAATPGVLLPLLFLFARRRRGSGLSTP